MKKLTVRQITLMAFCLVLGMFSKRIISPLTNMLTDFFRIPGGSLAVGFSLFFLIIGREMVPVPGSATLMGLVQSLLAIALGMSNYQGALAVITYTLPGAVIDLCALLLKKRDMAYFMISCVLSCLASSLLTNILVFHLAGISLVLWLLLAAVSGVLGGFLAQLLYHRLKKILKL